MKYFIKSKSVSSMLIEYLNVMILIKFDIVVLSKANRFIGNTEL